MELETGVFIAEDVLILCQICEDDEATKFCSNCKKNFCHDCLTASHKKKKDHKFISPKRKLNFTCKNHKKNVISFCHECEVLTCFDCIKKDGNHFNHKVEEIGNSSSMIREVAEKNVKNSTEISLIMKSNIDVLDKEVIELQNSLEEKLKKLSEAKVQFLDFERINLNFDFSSVEDCMEYIHLYSSLKPGNNSKFSWDPSESHPNLKLSNNNMTVTGIAPGDVIGTVGFSRGKHKWYINVDSSTKNPQFYIGVCRLEEINRNTKYNYNLMYGLSQQSGYIYTKGVGSPNSVNWIEKRKQAKVELNCDLNKLFVNDIEIDLPSNGNSSYKWYPIVVMGWYHIQEQITLSFEENDSIKHLTLSYITFLVPQTTYKKEGIP
jgi:hypothetical protein